VRIHLKKDSEFTIQDSTSHDVPKTLEILLLAQEHEEHMVSLIPTRVFGAYHMGETLVKLLLVGGLEHCFSI
jgi:hypothetical protein